MTIADFPEKLQFLFEPHRYKILYGGRGGAKSWGIARALLIIGAQRPIRVLCAREIQKSIKDSVHQLLKDQIAALGLSGLYEVLNTEIRGANGTLFVFEGLQHNIDNVKSKEAIDVVWVEEAQNTSKRSWDTLIPTIRKPGSEIWVSFNPELDTDETYARFVKKCPPDAVVKKINWSDNPWFPDVLKAEKDYLKQSDPDAYLTIWEGHCRQTLEGAIYAKEIRQATEEGRITRVPYLENTPVQTVWDLGYSDKTAIWFVQAVGFEYRLIDYVEDRQKRVPDWLRILQNRGYVYGNDYLPHDADAETMAGQSIAQQLRSAGRKVVIIPRMAKKAVGINAARSVFANTWFDEDKCADGLQCLRRYRYDVDPETGQWSKEPFHDEYSHGADAFAQFALSITNKRKPQQKPKGEDYYRPTTTAWMA